MVSFAESKDRWLRSPSEAEALFADIPEALASVEAIAAGCNLDLTKPFLPLPSNDLLTGMPAHEILLKRCNEIAKAFEKFGADRVAMVSSHHAFQARSALLEGLKALGYEEKVIQKIIRSLPPEDCRKEAMIC